MWWQFLCNELIRTMPCVKGVEKLEIFFHITSNSKLHVMCHNFQTYWLRKGCGNVQRKTTLVTHLHQSVTFGTTTLVHSSSQVWATRWSAREMVEMPRIFLVLEGFVTCTCTYKSPVLSDVFSNTFQKGKAQLCGRRSQLSHVWRQWWPTFITKYSIVTVYAKSLAPLRPWDSLVGSLHWTLCQITNYAYVPMAIVHWKYQLFKNTEGPHIRMIHALSDVCMSYTTNARKLSKVNVLCGQHTRTWPTYDLYFLFRRGMCCRWCLLAAVAIDRGGHGQVHECSVDSTWPIRSTLSSLVHLGYTIHIVLQQHYRKNWPVRQEVGHAREGILINPEIFCHISSFCGMLAN